MKPKAQQAQQAAVPPQGQVAQQAQQAPVPPEGQVAQLTPKQQNAVQWSTAAIAHFNTKPKAQTRTGDDLRLEFIAGSRLGYAGQGIDEAPAVRLTAGGRPVSGSEIDFEVSDGDLGSGAKTMRLVTNASGIARIRTWTLGTPRLHSILAEFKSLRADRTVRVS